jgi:hypothetical protein
MARALTKPLDVFPFLDNLGGKVVQNRNFGRFPFGDATKNDGVGVIFGNGVVNNVDAVVGGLFDILRDVGIVILPSRYDQSRARFKVGGGLLTSKTRSAPKLLTSSWFRWEAVETTLYPENLASWIAYCPTDELPP